LGLPAPAALVVHSECQKLAEELFDSHEGPAVLPEPLAEHLLPSIKEGKP
jgi:hypothetical protein